MIEAFRAVLKAGLSDAGTDKSLLAYALSLPEELTLLGEMDVMRPVALHEVGERGGGYRCGGGGCAVAAPHHRTITNTHTHTFDTHTFNTHKLKTHTLLTHTHT